MIEKRRSRIHGSGGYATATIPKNTRIIDYAGEKISNQESLKPEQRYLERGRIWCFKLTSRTVVDAGVGGNIARYINHSCQPNCYVDIRDGVIWIRASRSEEHTSELQSQSNLVCRLLLDKKRHLATRRAATIPGRPGPVWPAGGRRPAGPAG